MDKRDVANVFINPYYAINIDPGLLDAHRPPIEKSDWIEANLRLMGKLAKGDGLSDC